MECVEIFQIFLDHLNPLRLTKRDYQISVSYFENFQLKNNVLV